MANNQQPFGVGVGGGKRMPVEAAKEGAKIDDAVRPMYRLDEEVWGA